MPLFTPKPDFVQTISKLRCIFEDMHVADL